MAPPSPASSGVGCPAHGPCSEQGGSSTAARPAGGGLRDTSPGPFPPCSGPTARRELGTAARHGPRASLSGVWGPFPSQRSCSETAQRDPSCVDRARPQAGVTPITDRQERAGTRAPWHELATAPAAGRGAGPSRWGSRVTRGPAAARGQEREESQALDQCGGFFTALKATIIV